MENKNILSEVVEKELRAMTPLKLPRPLAPVVLTAEQITELVARKTIELQQKKKLRQERRAEKKADRLAFAAPTEASPAKTVREFETPVLTKEQIAEDERDRLAQELQDDIEYNLSGDALRDFGPATEAEEISLQAKINKFLGEPEKNLEWEALYVWLGATSAGREILKSMDIPILGSLGSFYIDGTGLHKTSAYEGEMVLRTDGSYVFMTKDMQKELELSGLKLKSPETVAAEQKHWSQELKAFAHERTTKIANARVAHETAERLAWTTKMGEFEKRYIAHRKTSKSKPIPPAPPREIAAPIVTKPFLTPEQRVAKTLDSLKGMGAGEI